ncbi:MAG: hypothetical protein ABS888_01675 [Eubacteriales bacterium]
MEEHDWQKGRVRAMDVRFILKADATLTEDQVREIEASRQFPFVEDEDSPEVDPQKNPELWAKALEALASRNRRMAKRMA